MGRQHFNGLKTAALFGVLWAVLLGIGQAIAVAMGRPPAAGRLVPA